MFAVDCDQVEVELGGSLGLCVLEDDLEVGCLLVGLEGKLVSVVGQLHDLRQIRDGDTEHHVSVGSVVVEALHRQVEGHKSHMGGIHGLERDSYKV